MRAIEALRTRVGQVHSTGAERELALGGQVRIARRHFRGLRHFKEHHSRLLFGNADARGLAAQAGTD